MNQMKLPGRAKRKLGPSPVQLVPNWGPSGRRDLFEVNSSQTTNENLPLAFLLLRGHQAFPSTCGFDLLLQHAAQPEATEQALWPLGLQKQEELQKTPQTTTQVRIKCCTLNVRTLYSCFWFL